MNVDFAVVCDYAIVDQYGKLSVLGMFQHIWVAAFPTLHPRLHLVVRLRGKRTEVGNHQLAIRMTGPDDEEVLTGSGSVTFNEPPAGVLEIEAGTILAFDVPFKQEGRYEFEVTVDGEVARKVPITVSQSPRGGPASSGPELH